jgi:hypothetical protein
MERPGLGRPGRFFVCGGGDSLSIRRGGWYDPDMLPDAALGILDRMIKPDDPSLSPEVARHFLQLRFSEAEVSRLNALSERAREGSLTEAETLELDGFLLLSHWIGVLQSKARTSLKATTSAA